MRYHKAWAVVNEATGNVVAIKETFCIYSEEGKAWAECLELREQNPKHKLSVKQTTIPLYWGN